MEISGITNGKVDLGKILEGAFPEEGPGGVKGLSGILGDDNLTISIRDEELGVEVVRTVKLPEIHEETLDEDVAAFLDAVADAIDEMIEDLKRVAADMGEPEPTPEGGEDTPVDPETKVQGGTDTSKMTSASKTLFSIYDLINLMQQLSQAQRNNAREIRYSELESQVASIKSQADHQRMGALYGLIASGVSCLVQAGMMVGTTIAGAKALCEQSRTGAGQQVEQATRDIKTLEAGLNSPEAAAKNYTDIKTSVTKTEGGQTLVDAVERKMADPYKDSPDVAKAQGELDAAKQELDALKAAKANNTTVKVDGKDVHVSEKMIKSAEAKVNEATVKVADAKVAALDKIMSGKDAEFNELAEKTKGLESDFLDGKCTAKEVADARAELAESGQERMLLKAKVTELKTGIAKDVNTQLGAKHGTYDAGMKEDYAKARAAQTDAQAGQRTDRMNVYLNNRMALFNAIQQLNQSVGQLGQGLAHFVQATEEAKGTEDQAKQKEFEQFRDETNQLFQQAQEVINNVRALLQAVIQAEAQSLEQIFRA